MQPRAASFALPAGAQQETIRIGVLQSFSGITGLSGRQAEGVVKLFMKQHGDTVGGKKIEFFTRDTTGPNPEVAKRLVQEAVTRERAQILIGPDYTPNTLAAAPLRPASSASARRTSSGHSSRSRNFASRWRPTR